MTCCSIGAATVSATTFELAPGYVQLTCTVGGVISGYWATGRIKTAMLPISVMITEITAAKIGRLIKNFATSLIAPGSIAGAGHLAGAPKPAAPETEVHGRQACVWSLVSHRPAPIQPPLFDQA